MCVLKSPALVYWTAEVQMKGAPSAEGERRVESQSMWKRMKYAGGSSTTEPGEGQEAAKTKIRADFKRTASSMRSSNGRMQ